MTTPIEDAVVAQDIVAERIVPAAVAAVEAARAGASAPAQVVEAAVDAAAWAAATAILTALLRQNPSARPSVSVPIVATRVAEVIRPGLVEDLWDGARAVAAKPIEVVPVPETPADFARRLIEPQAPLQSVADRKKAKLLARTLATRTAAESVLENAKELELPTKVWITRGDQRVRELHRRLHGNAVPLDKPFRKWPSGQVLGYPGDKRAPMDAWINCRCFLWAATSAKGVQEALGPSDFDRSFALAASLERAFFSEE